MIRTRMYISFLKPLLGLLDPPLEEFITRYEMPYCMMLHELFNCVVQVTMLLFFQPQLGDHMV